MDTRRCYPNEDVAHGDLAPVDKFRFLDHSGRITCDVILSICIHPGHLCRLSADKGATGLAAALCDAGYDGLDHLRTGLSLSHIIEEEEGFRPLGQDVVHAHRDSVYADSVVLVHRKRDLKLGSYTVGTTHQDRLPVIQRREVEHSAESPDITHHSGPGRRSHVLLYPPDDIIARLEAYTSFFVIDCHIYLINYSPLK